MLRRALALVFGVFLVCAPSRAQQPAAPPKLESVPGVPIAVEGSKNWIGREAEFEDFLKQAKVERVENVPVGVTKPKRAFVAPGGLAGSFVFKELMPGRKTGFFESYKSEIAAYELDKVLGLDMVPPAVEREINGETGAAIMWIEGTRSVKQTGGKMPAGAEWAKASRKLMMFDNLIGNPDRNAGNILLGVPGEFILIDHSRAFVADKKLRHKFERVDAALWDRIRSLTPEDVKRALGTWLDDRAIDAMIERRNLMAAAVDKLVAHKGAEAVIIP